MDHPPPRARSSSSTAFAVRDWTTCSASSQHRRAEGPHKEPRQHAPRGEELASPELVAMVEAKLSKPRSHEVSAPGSSLGWSPARADSAGSVLNDMMEMLSFADQLLPVAAAEAMPSVTELRTTLQTTAAAANKPGRGDSSSEVWQ